MIYGLVGFAGSGKDTVGNYFAHNEYVKYSFANTLKDVCSILFGWDRSKLEGDSHQNRIWREQTDDWWSQKLNIPDFSPRKAMQYVGTDALRFVLSDDLWIINLEKQILKNSHQKVVVTDCRFPNEIEFVKSLGGEIIWVQKHQPSWFSDAMKAISGHQTMEFIELGIHESEWRWLSCLNQVDHIVENSGTINDLYIKLEKFL